jgi:hypothetical protein
MTAQRRLHNIAASQTGTHEDAPIKVTAGIDVDMDTGSWNGSTPRAKAEPSSHRSYQTREAPFAAAALWDFTKTASLSMEELSLPILEA